MSNDPSPNDPLVTRQRLATWPRALQPMFTWVSCIALPGQRCRVVWTARTHVLAHLLVYLASTTLGIWGVVTMLDAVA